ncbi:ABC transporter ATP-binding protein [Pseudaminobacter salicylatoxidans]|uniref:ABC transporter ATP-binding protein n=1 Tax=Pseudaminobacter salicylatoxidans TaxID=93369 RepID=UPI0002DF80A5|nr:ABC transporter ATP-binding protein [Pseudaminobacter salicylatoxidans]
MKLSVALDSITHSQWDGTSRKLVENIAFEIPQGTTMGIVGESGSGKSLTSLAIMSLLPPGMTAQGRIELDGADLLQLSPARMRKIRGVRIGMIFQEPMTALNPAMRIGDQIAEGLLAHKSMSRSEARAEALGLLDRVRIPDAKRRIDSYPHEMSGGQRQRVGIAIALAPGPSLLIADEPTTALDVTVQAEVLALLGELISDLKMSLLMISHDLGVIASICERTLVMQSGCHVESGATQQVLRNPKQDYTRRLISAIPRREDDDARRLPAAGPGETPVLEVQNLSREYRSLSGQVLSRAVNDLSFTVRRGTIFGIVGESGCGKSTLSRIVMGLDRPTAGKILFDGEDLFAKKRHELRLARRGFQMVFQDPRGSLDPRQCVARIIAEPLHLDPHAPKGKERDEMIAEALTSVGLKPDDARKYPHQFSGGQRQRIAIARALICRPKLVVADEPVSALDLSVQAQVLELIRELRDKQGVAFLFISHSLAVVESISDDIGVMHRGQFVETGRASDVFANPTHPYTRTLIAAEPRIDQPRRYGLAAADKAL